MKHPAPGTDYDPSSVDDIVYYALNLQGSSLRKALDIPSGHAFERKGKGGFGESVEYYYFGYEPNSKQAPDFEEAGIELKVTPLKIVRGNELVPKERLVITMIDYMTVINENFETSTLNKKLERILLMHYLHDDSASPFDYKFELVHLWTVPEEDYPTIKADWEFIVNKIRSGLAHELSGGDTNYLEATTKASDSSKTREQPFSEIPAKPRAFALKSSYMRTVLNSKMQENAIKRDEDQHDMGLEELVKDKFNPYIGLSSTMLAKKFDLNIKAKGFYASVTNRILGLAEKEIVCEFEKAGIKPKTIRLKQNGMPKEDISFKAMKYKEVVSQEWEDSDLYADLTSRYLFVLYRIGKEGSHEATRLEDVVFWTMPVGDLESEGKRCFEETIERILAGKASSLPKKSENRCVHVRPHARNRVDTSETPQGDRVTKKSFWLNAGYIASEIERIRNNEKTGG